MPSEPSESLARAEPDGRWRPALWGLLFVLAGNMLIDSLEVSLALVALPALGAALALDLPTAQWVVSGFAAGFGGLLLFGGRLVAGIGRRPVYLAALMVFAAASLAGALMDSAAPLIATRVLKGFCAALTAPTGLAIIVSVFPEGPARRRAISVYALFGACGLSAGLLVSGALTTEAGWRWALAAPAPVALLLFLAGLRLIPRDAPGGTRPRPYDWAGALTLTGAVLSLVYGIVSVPDTGWSDPRTVGGFALAALLGTLFLRTESTSPDPLLRFELLRNAVLVRSALGAASLNGSFLGLLLLSTVHLQRHAGWSSWETALAFLPAGLPLVVTALHGGWLAQRFGPARLIAAGAAAATLGYVLYPSDPAAEVRYLTDVAPTMLLLGAAFTCAFTALHLQATGSVPSGLQAAAGGLYQTSVQMSAAVMVALTSALSTAGFRPALLLLTGVGLFGCAVALHGLLPRRQAVAGVR